jgi:hypothetical protein
MAEFALPKNSRVKPGKHFPAPAGAKKVKRFKIYRYEPEDGQNPGSTRSRSTSTTAGRWSWTR